MGRFSFSSREEIEFTSPQEMYSDYKKKTIKGILDYQSDVIDTYMKSGYKKRDVAIELPTGSGKTLVGLLLAEYRRRKGKEKVVYVCPTNQLVNQVVEKSIHEYGIDVVGFTGSQHQYDSQDISLYRSARKIAVTNYSSIFNTNSFFDDADVIIFDDAHSAENYIASNWSLSIKKHENTDLFLSLAECLKPAIESATYRRLIEEGEPGIYEDWCDLVPLIKQNELIDDLYDIIDARVSATGLRFTWSNIKEHLNVCNLFLSKREIVFRPYIPPTSKFNTFFNPKQRIYMSATLGESGELERTVGVNNIFRITMSEYNRPSIGRRFFLFPNVNFSPDDFYNIFEGVKALTPRGLVLVESNKEAAAFKSMLMDGNSEIEVFDAQDIEVSLSSFENNENGVAILANRYDGINLQDDTCHLLVLSGLPSATNLQEKFFIHKLSTSVLFSERIKTRITQAVGRCTRTTTDYAVVLVTGRELENNLISPDKLELFDSELRAELTVGFDVSSQVKDVNDFIDVANLGFTREGDWAEIETEILKVRNELRKKEVSRSNPINDELKSAAEFEVKFQYSLWMKDYEEAINHIETILTLITQRELSGYRQYWNYMCGSLYDILYMEKKEELLRFKANEYYDRASSFSNTITWFRKLKRQTPERTSQEEKEVSYAEVLDRIESDLAATKINRRLQKFERESNLAMTLLKEKGIKFEQGVELLGTLLGYDAHNSSADGAPDPWWIINENLIIVTENKIYDSTEKKIPKKHVLESAGHPNWILDNVKDISMEAKIVNVFITNAEKLEPSALPHSKEIFYINVNELIKYAQKALPIQSSIRRIYTSEGSYTWRFEAEKMLKEGQVTPDALINIIQRFKLDDLSVE